MIWMHGLCYLPWPGYGSKACINRSLLSTLSGPISNMYFQWFLRLRLVQMVENQEGGPWGLCYMESWNHVAHGPCIHEYF